MLNWEKILRDYQSSGKTEGSKFLERNYPWNNCFIILSETHCFCSRPHASYLHPNCPTDHCRNVRCYNQSILALYIQCDQIYLAAISNYMYACNLHRFVKRLSLSGLTLPPVVPLNQFELQCNMF